MNQQIPTEKLQEFGKLEFLARQVVEGFITGLHKSPFHGFSVEFSEHRLYNTGESVKNIDWKLYSRTDKLFVKRFEEETNLRCQLVVDASSSMYFPENGDNKIRFSALSAAAIMQMLKNQRDAVGLSVFSDKLELHHAPKSSTAHHKLLIHELEQQMVKPKAPRGTSAVAYLNQFADMIHRRSLVIIFSDMFDAGTDASELFQALQHLRYNKHEVILFHVVDQKQEVMLDFDNRPHIFIDMETGERLKLNPFQVQEEYRKQLDAWKKELKMRCGQYKIDFVEADINLGFQQVLMPFLLRRKGMM